MQEKGLTSCNKRYLELLHQAKLYGEHEVSLAIDLLLEGGKTPLKEDVLELIKKKTTPKTAVVTQPNLEDYDTLFEEKVAS